MVTRYLDLSDDDKRLLDELRDGNVDAVRPRLAADPELARRFILRKSLLHHAVNGGSVELVRLLLQHGGDPNTGEEVEGYGFRSWPLLDAVGNGSLELTKLLLEHGADAGVEEPIVSAITGRCVYGWDNSPLPIIELLVRHGADLHKVYPFGPNLVPMNALSMAEIYGPPAAVKYLRSLGAVPADEVPDEVVYNYYGAVLTEQRKRCLAYHKRWDVRLRKRIAEGFDRLLRWIFSRKHKAEKLVEAPSVVDYFAREFGPVDPLSITEIVPTEPEIVVHAIPSGEGRPQVTLFTSGMSAQAMHSPAADYRYAELFLQLPADWNYRDFQDIQHGWPVLWLRTVAQTPFRNGDSLGQAVAVFNAEGPLGPEMPFDAWLLMAERKFLGPRGKLIQLYRMTPLYPEERELEYREGIVALMHTLDAAKTPFVFDPQRPNAANTK